MLQGLVQVSVGFDFARQLKWPVDTSVKVTVVLAVALGLYRVLRRAEARTRHALLSAALLGALVMPVISHMTPKWHLGLWPDPPIWLTTLDEYTHSPGLSATHIGDQAAFGPGFGTKEPPHLRNVDSASPGPAAMRPQFSWSALILSVWVAGAAVILGRLALGLARVTRLARKGTPVRSDRWRRITAQLISEGRMSHRISLLEHHKINVPFTFGLFSPTILLPTDAGSWSFERRRLVLMHELSHIQRNDWLIHMIVQFTCALHWFNPLIWIAARCLHTVQEQACDERVVLLGAKPSAYAAHLLDVARSIAPARTLPVATWATTHRNVLEKRVQSVLRPERSRRRSVAVLAILQVSMASVVLFVAILAPTSSRTWTRTLPAMKHTEDHARRRLEDRISRRISEAISRTISKSIGASIRESIAASMTLTLPTDSSGDIP